MPEQFVLSLFLQSSASGEISNVAAEIPQQLLGWGQFTNSSTRSQQLQGLLLFIVIVIIIIIIIIIIQKCKDVILREEIPWQIWIESDMKVSLWGFPQTFKAQCMVHAL